MLVRNTRAVLKSIRHVMTTWAVIGTLGMLSSEVGQAQHRDELTSIQEDIATLRRDVGTLGKRQQQIINELKELTDRLKANIDAPSEASLLISVGHDESFMGATSAPVVVIEYADFECRFCLEYKSQVYPKIVEDYVKTGRVKYFFRDFPSTMHTRAVWAARAARCAGEQNKFWEMHDVLFAEEEDSSDKAVFARAVVRGVDKGKLVECLATERHMEEIRQGISDARRLGVDRTPEFLLGRASSDGAVVKISKTIRGMHPYEIFKSDLDALLLSEERSTRVLPSN